MSDWLAQRAAATPDKTALITEGQHITFADLLNAVRDDQAWLHAAGIRQGDRVAVWLPNNALYARLIFALAQQGAVIVPLNTRLTAEEVSYQLEAAGATALIGDLPADLHTQARLLDVPDGCQSYEAAPIAANDLKRVQGIMFSSGTTGQPKGIQLTFGNHYHSAVASAFRLGVLPDDQWLACMPLYHVGGQAIIMRACLYGMTVNLHPRFDVAAVNRAIEEDGVTLVSLVPTMLHRLMDYRGDAPFPESLRLVLLGGAAAPAQLIARCAAVDLPVAATYGLTEAASQVATATPAQVRAKPGTVGKALMGTQVDIVADDHTPCAPHEVGEIRVKGPTVMAGYLNRTPHEGWLYTGDLGYKDDDGDLWVVTRRTDLIVSGGENVYPVEVEDALEAHPGVKTACVVGVTDPEWGQRVTAMVVRTDDTLTADMLTSHSRGVLAGYKIPRRIVFVDTLPATASGKIKRTQVQRIMENKQHVL